MSQQDQKSFFDRLGEILNAPLPGTEAPQPTRQPEEVGGESGVRDPSLLERIREILNTPLSGSPQTPEPPGNGEPTDRRPESSETGVAAQPEPPQGPAPDQAPTRRGEPTPELDEDDLEEPWWKQDWAGFRAHQEQEAGGLEQKQREDLAKFAAYQDAEKRRFEAHQAQELDLFRQQQQWRLNAWKQATAANPGVNLPPPPWGMPGAPGMVPPPGGPPPGPMAPPPWMWPPGPPRGR